MRKPPVFAVEKQNPRQCLCLWRKHKSDGKKQENGWVVGNILNKKGDLISQIPQCIMNSRKVFRCKI